MITARSALAAITQRLLRVSAYGVVAGLLAYLVIFGPTVRLQGLIWCVGTGLGYSAIMLTSIEVVVRIVDRRWPIRSRSEIAARVPVVAATALISFLLATYAVELVLGFQLFRSGSTLMLSAVMALAATAVGSALYFLNAYKARLRETEMLAAQSELQALRAQVNPHFLFNALNSIAALIRIAPQRAEEVTEALADLFRYSLRASSQTMVCLEEEFSSVEMYLAIERARFGDRLNARWTLPEGLRQARLPSLLLQPLVENAVKHGVARTSGVCTIDIIATATGDTVTLIVRDDGPGFPVEQEESIFSRGHGLANVRNRLRLQFGGRAVMILHANQVELRFPFLTKPEEYSVATDMLHR